MSDVEVYVLRTMLVDGTEDLEVFSQRPTESVRAELLAAQDDESQKVAGASLFVANVDGGDSTLIWEI